MILNTTKENTTKENTTKEELEAMELIRQQLTEDQSLSSLFRKASRKCHPDRGGDVAVFHVVSKLSETVTPFLDKDKKPSKSERVNLSQALTKLPEDISQALLTKIRTENPRLANVNLTNPVLFDVKNTYAHAASNPLEGRSHYFQVNANKFAGLKEKFQDIKGDFLKSNILNDFKEQIENTYSKEELTALKEQIKQSAEYKVLSTGQGHATKVFGLKTSSVAALEKMFTGQEKNISNAPSPN